MFDWFDTKSSEAFASELASFMLNELKSRNAEKNANKFSVKAQKTLDKAALKISTFRQANDLNFYKKSKLANSFLWTLKDGGCPPDYATELTEWLTLRL